MDEVDKRSAVVISGSAVFVDEHGGRGRAPERLLLVRCLWPICSYVESFHWFMCIFFFVLVGAVSALTILYLIWLPR